MTDRRHWDTIYATRAPDDVSWYQPAPSTSLSLIDATRIPRDAPLLDVGGGASVLVDSLLDRGFADVSVLDIAPAALASARARLGHRAALARWYEADVRDLDLGRTFALWHDRAVFHFMTDASSRAAYLASLDRHLEPDGHVVLATFSPDGPTRCSGLDVVRYDEASIARELGPRFALRASRAELHLTPSSRPQPFTYFHFTRVTPRAAALSPSPP